MIKSLTQSQKDRLPEFREKWLKIGFCTEPANRKEAEEAIRQSYSLAGLVPPERIVWCGSPSVIAATTTIEAFEDKSVRDSISAAVRDSVRHPVSAAVRGSVRDSVSAAVSRSVEGAIWNNAVMNSVWRSIGYHIDNFSYGQHDAGWLSFFDYFREVVGLREETERLTGLIELARHAGWWAPYEKICFVSERHNFLSFDARGRLHSLSGPAITYPDGWKIYVVHGVTVPSWIIEDKSAITVAKIESEAYAEIHRENAEIRRVMTEIYGHERYIRDSGAELIAKDDYGELYRKNITDDEPLVMVKVINSTPEPDGSSKEYWLRVDPNLRPLLGEGQFGNAQEATARNAIASTFGLYGQEYIVSRQT